MRQRLLILMGIYAASILAACNRPSPSPSANKRVSEEATQLNVEMASAKIADKKIEQKVEPSASNEPKAEVAELTEVADKKPTISVNSSERVAILTPDGPIVAEVSVSIDGRSAADTFDDVLAKLLAAADSNNDNRPTWQELAANTKYLSTQGESMPDRALSQLKTWTEQFDRNRDAQIQRDEAAAWLGRQAGTTARAFDVRGTRSYTSFRSAGSRVWKLLDADQNNRLTKQEVARAAATLLSLDNNDDRTITPEELVPLGEQLPIDGARTSGSTLNNQSSVIYLKPQYEIDRLEYVLSDLYAPRQLLRPASFPSLAPAYKTLDADGDDHLTQVELEAMRTMSPQLRLAVDFRQVDGRSHASVSALEHAPEFSTYKQPNFDRIILIIGSSRLLVLAGGRTSPENAHTASASQIQMMVHDQSDALGEAIDSDADGKLGEHEIESCSEGLWTLDGNHDGEISNNELPYTMIVGIMRGEPIGEKALDRPLFNSNLSELANAPSWFVHADYNGDGEVSRREFVASPEQFSLLDRNHDGYIDLEEAKHGGGFTPQVP